MEPQRGESGEGHSVSTEVTVSFPSKGEIGTPVQILQALVNAERQETTASEEIIRNPPNVNFDKVSSR